MTDLAIELRAILLAGGTAPLVADLRVELLAVLRLDSVAAFLPCFRHGHVALRVTLAATCHQYHSSRAAALASPRRA